jgi:hypothetical protein
MPQISTEHSTGHTPPPQKKIILDNYLTLLSTTWLSRHFLQAGIDLPRLYFIESRLHSREYNGVCSKQNHHIQILYQNNNYKNPKN